MATAQIVVTARLRTSLRSITTPDELLGLRGMAVLLLLLLSQRETLGPPAQARYLVCLLVLGLPHPLNISFWCATLGPTTAVYSCQVLQVENHVTTLLWIHPASIFEPRTPLAKG